MSVPAGAPARWLRPFRRPTLWCAGWAVLFALVATGSLLPASDVPSMPVPGLDKLQHFLGYAALSTYGVMLFGRMRPQALAAALAVAFGVGVEWAQGALTADRNPEAADAMANALGALAGLLLASTPMAHGLQRLDARLFPRQPPSAPDA